jgi:hypothetical protein
MMGSQRCATMQTVHRQAPAARHFLLGRKTPQKPSDSYPHRTGAGKREGAAPQGSHI